MSYRQDHPVVFTIGAVFVIATAIVASIFTIGKYSVEAAKIQAEKDIKTTEIHEREETERTEEKSQFWQKLVPWGNYETEESK